MTSCHRTRAGMRILILCPYQQTCLSQQRWVVSLALEVSKRGLGTMGFAA